MDGVLGGGGERAPGPCEYMGGVLAGDWLVVVGPADGPAAPTSAPGPENVDTGPFPCPSLDVLVGLGAAFGLVTGLGLVTIPRPSNVPSSSGTTSGIPISDILPDSELDTVNVLRWSNSVSGMLRSVIGVSARRSWSDALDVDGVGSKLKLNGGRLGGDGSCCSGGEDGGVGCCCGDCSFCG
jgi:hypothetical protein